MRQLFAKSVGVMVVIAAAYQAGAFSLLGPWKEGANYPDPWQGVGYLGYADGFGFHGTNDIGGPMGLDEEYRWNVRHLYYACDQSFLNYFGTRGMQAISNAVAILNAVPNASQMDNAYLTRRYAQSGMLRQNMRAQTLGLLDVKSTALELMVEELGLGNPIRFMYNVRTLWPAAPAAPQTITVVNLNFDPLTLAPANSVNGVLYGYNINITPTLVDAVELPVTTPLVDSDPVAAQPILRRGGIGQYWVNLTRDDVGALRYMLRTNNQNVEPFLPGTEIATTNGGSQVLFTNQDLRLLISRTQGTTNDAATVLGYYPGLNITGSNSYYRLDTRGSLLYYFTNAPFGSQTQQLGAVLTTNFVPFYNYTYDNVVTNTNLLSTNLFYILSSNLLDYVQPVTNYLLTNVVMVTNAVFDVDPAQGLDLAGMTNRYFVDTNNQVAVTTSNLALLIEQGRTNSAAALQTLYPDLLISSTYSVVTNQLVTNYVAYPTNAPFAPAGTITPVYVQEVTNTIVTNYYHRFANVVTNNLYTNSPVSVQKYEIYRPYGAPAGSPIVNTNIRSTTYYSNVMNGDYYIVPTNLVGYHLVAVLATNQAWTSNSLDPVFLGTNQFGTNTSIGGTNALTGTNAIVYTNKYLVTHGTNYIFAAYPVAAPVSYYTQVVAAANAITWGSPTNAGTNAGLLRLGVDKIQIHETFYDSLLSQAYLLTTNAYWESYVTKSRATNIYIRRLITVPDFLFVSEDLGGQNGLPLIAERTDTTAWINNDAINGDSVQGGPGTITPPIRISFTDQLPYTVNAPPFFLNETTAATGVRWGSFDGTTNAPIVYPDLLSIEDLEWQVLNPPPPTYP